MVESRKVGDDKDRVFADLVAVTKVDHGPKNTAWLHARKADGTPVTFLLIDHQPYFYAEPADFKHPGIADVQTGFRSITGEPLVRYVTHTPGDVRELRRFFKRPCEADVPYTQRVVTDVKCMGMAYIVALKVQGEYVTKPTGVNFRSNEVTTQLDIVYYDIEVANDGGQTVNGMLINARNEIISISAYDRTKDSFVAWLYHPTTKVDITSVQFNKMGSRIVTVHQFTDERKMLAHFGRWVETRRPDFLAGWNSNRFDATYIIRRCARLGLYKPFGHKGMTSDDPVNVPGVQLLDLLPIHRRASKRRMKRNGLKDVAKAFCGIDLVKEPGNIMRWWIENPAALLDYNLKDVEATFCIDQSEEYSQLAIDTMYLTQVDGVMDGFKPMITHDVNYLRLKDRNVALPMKPERTGKPEKFTGAVVQAPIAGIHDWVVGLDVRSLYPTSGITGNLSIETYCTLPLDLCQRPHFLVPEVGHRFHTDVEGFTARIYRELLAAKDRYDRMMKAAVGTPKEKTYAKMRWASKIQINAGYGVHGNSYFRMFHRPVAESTTAIGRAVATTMVEEAKKTNAVVLGDTDAVYAKVPARDVHEAIRLGAELAERVESVARKKLADLGAKQPELLEVEFEKVYSRLLASKAKKRYAGLIVAKGHKILKEPELDVVGFDAVRSDAPDLSIRLQTDVLLRLLRGDNFDEVARSVDKVLVSVRDGKVDWRLVAPTPELSQDLDEYDDESSYYAKTAAEWSNANLGKTFGEGDRLFVVHVKKVPKPYTPATSIALAEGDELPPGFVVDWERHAEVAVTKKMANVFEAIGYGWRVASFGNTRLADFFS